VLPPSSEIAIPNCFTAEFPRGGEPRPSLTDAGFGSVVMMVNISTI
jgi:hypothetical protein